MATYSRVLAWRIPETGEPGGLPSLGSHRVRHNRSDLAAAAAHWASPTHTHKKQIHFQEKLVLVLPHILTSVLRLMAIINPQILLGIGRYTFFPSLIMIAL